MDHWMFHSISLLIISKNTQGGNTVTTRTFDIFDHFSLLQRKHFVKWSGSGDFRPVNKDIVSYIISQFSHIVWGMSAIFSITPHMESTPLYPWQSIQSLSSPPCVVWLLLQTSNVCEGSQSSRSGFWYMKLSLLRTCGFVKVYTKISLKLDHTSSSAPHMPVNWLTEVCARILRKATLHLAWIVVYYLLVTAFTQSL